MKKIIILLGLAVFIAALSACNGDTITYTIDVTNVGNRPTVDREGHALSLPDEINSIISIGPSSTEMLTALGFANIIIQTDNHSGNVPGISSEIATLDMFALDFERIIDLAPDIVFIIGMTRVEGDEDPLRMVSDTGISVVYMPTSTAIADIKEDIRFMAAVLEVDSLGDSIVADMNSEIERVREIGETITERKTVYFEISPAPHMFSFGSGTFLNEIIDIVGAVNIFADQDGWIGVSDEILLEANPDVIITSVDFLDDPVAEIMDRPGWNAIAAVQNGNVFQVTTNYTNRPSQNIIRGLWEIAIAIYPEYFQ